MSRGIASRRANRPWARKGMTDRIIPDDPFEDLARAVGMLVICFNELEVALGARS